MIGKKILDSAGIGASNNMVISPTIKPFVDITMFDKFKADIQSVENDPIQLDVKLNEYGFNQVKQLREYIEKTGAENLKQGSVNQLITEQNFSNTAMSAHGFTGVKKAISEYNSLIKSGSADTNKFVETIQGSNPKLASAMGQFKDGSMSIKNYAGSLAAASVKSIALQASTMALNMAIGTVVGLVVGKLIEGIDYLLHKTEKLGEALETSNSKYTESVDNFIKILIMIKYILYHTLSA